jgi:FAD synthetase
MGPPMARTAGIILIGNELLSGKVVDANASYLCRELRALGVDVRRISVIPDEVDLIASEVAHHSRTLDVVFTSGGVGPTHDDVTIEGVAQALGVAVVRDPRLVTLIERFAKGRLNEARLKMAEVPEGAELVAGEELAFPAVAIRNIYVLPGVPEIFRQKFQALRERFRESPFHLRSVFVSIPEGTLAEHLNALLRRHPDLLLGSYPEFLNPEYKVKITLESKDREYVERALEDLLAGLPGGAVVRVER